MKKLCRYLLASIAVLSVALPALPQSSGQYGTNKLKELGKNIMSYIDLDGDLPDGYHQLPAVPAWDGYPLTIHVTNERIIDHIGICLFERRQTRDKDIDVLFDFIERYLLELALINDKSKIAGITRDDEVVIECGDFNDLKKITASHLLEIARHDMKTCRVSWKDTANDKIIYAISFPLKYELILGMNKIEAENNLPGNVMMQQMHGIEAPRPVKNDDLVHVPQRGYYMKQGEKYMIESMNSNLYYKKDGTGNFVLLCNPEFVAESLSNLMVRDETEGSYMLDITQYKYGRNTGNFIVPLKQWIRYCLGSGCKPYFGVEAQDEAHITASVIMENKRLGYNHILHFVFDRRLLNEASGTIIAKLYSYIPTHNVADLFHETKTGKTSQ